MSGVELPAYSAGWKLGRGGGDEEEESHKVMPTCALSPSKNVSDRGAGGDSGTSMDGLGSAGEACSLFQILLRRHSRGTGCQDASIRREKPTFAPQIASMPLSMTTSLY